MTIGESHHTSEDDMKGNENENDGGLRERIETFGQRLQEEAKGVETRVKEGIQEAVDESKRRDRRLGRAPGLSRRPPSGHPPSRRPRSNSS